MKKKKTQAENIHKFNLKHGMEEIKLSREKFLERFMKIADNSEIKESMAKFTK